MREHPQKILVVDDDRGVREFISEVAEEAGFAVASAADAEEFKKAYRERLPDRIILDLHLSNGDGIELLRFLAAEKSRAEIILVSGVDSRTLATAERLGKQHGLQMGAALHKPLTVEMLENALKVRPGDKSGIDEDDILRALAEEQMSVFFQPVIQRQKDGQWLVRKVEALARWDHPKWGLLMPGKFISRTEELDLISPLTDSVLQKSLQQVKKWEQAGAPLSVAVNLSGKMMSD